MLLLTLILTAAACVRLSLGQASPCPDTLRYEPRNPDEPDRWYGVIELRSEDDLEGIWVKVNLDTKAELLGNWFGVTSSADNTEFHIRNPQYKLEAGPPVSVRFFVKYNVDGPIPSVKKILLNGKTICSIYQEAKPTRPTLHISRPSDGNPALELDVVGPPIDDDRRRVPTHRGEENQNDRFTSGNTYNSNQDRQEESNRPNGHQYNSNSQESRPNRNDYEKPGYGEVERPENDRYQNRNPSHKPSENDGNRKPTGYENTSSNNRQTSRPSSSTRKTTTSFVSGEYNYNNKESNNKYTTRSSNKHTTTTIPDLSNIRDEHGRPIFETNNHQQKPSTNNHNTESNRHHGTTSRPTHHSNTNQLSIATNDDLSENQFFPGDYVNLINRPSTRPQNVITRVKPECGTVAARANALISHGQDTKPGQWPWHAAIYHSKGIQLVYTCGGTLIAEQYVLTAAHCVTRPSTNQKVDEKYLLIYLGKYNLIAFGSEVQDRDIEEIYVHPQYNHSRYFNDIAMLKLSRPVEITNNVRPCCLWEGSSDNIDGKHGTVVGWGFDENKQLSRNLMQAEMPIVPTVKCIYSNREFFSQFTFENNFCAGFRNGTSVCNGDSGGGMVFPVPGTSDNNPAWQLRGIVSVGVALQTQGICDTSHYIIFTDVTKYLTWIKKIINTNDT